jgi:hypothetical protein
VTGCYVALSVCRCNIIFLNVYARNEEKSDDYKDSFYEELDQEFYHFSKHYVRKFNQEILMQKWRER